MSYIHYDPRTGIRSLYDSKNRFVRSLGKITKDQALKEHEFFKKQMEIKP